MDTQPLQRGSSEMLEGSSPHQKVIDGKIFPKIILPSCSSGSVHHAQKMEDMLQILKKNKTFLEEQLYEYGAVMLRGFPFQSAADFDAVLEAIGWEEFPYVGTGVRKRVIGRVYTASDSRADRNIPFHHEMIQVKSGAAPKLVFFCEIEPADRGQTPLVVSHKITEKMQEEFPDFVRKIEEEGLLYIRTFPAETDYSVVVGPGWSTMLGTTDRSEAEKRAADQFDARLEWLPDGKVDMIGGPYEPIRAFDKERGRKAWFNKIACGEDEKLYRVVFKDGTPLPSEVVARCKELHEEMCVEVPWRKGDVMILNNLAVMHAKRPCYHPRRILGAFCH